MPVNVSPGIPQSYCTAQDILDRYGSAALLQVSNLDNNTTEVDYDRVERAIQYANRTIDARFDGSIYLVPLRTSASGIPPIVKDWAVVLAYAWLYNDKGQSDTNKNGNKMTMEVDRVRAEMMNAMALDRPKIGAVYSGIVNTPSVISL